MSHNRQKKIAVINDFTGFGKCSLTVALPIISHMGLQCCPVPTAILSNHTAYDEYFFEDYTKNMNKYISMWKKLSLEFDGICTGFLGSLAQIDIVKDFCTEFKGKNTKIIVDPIMADNGVPYKTYTRQMCLEMKELVKISDIVTPNITEACILTDTEYKNNFDKNELRRIGEKLCSYGPKNVVITGIESEKTIANYVYSENGEMFVRCLKNGVNRCGTGDVFSSIIAADAVNGVDFKESVKKATRFIKESLNETIRLDMDPLDGVAFENVLHKLK